MVANSVLLQTPSYSFLQTTPAALLALALFGLLVLVYVLAHRFRAYRLIQRPDLEKFDISNINTMLLGLLGLILAFAFSMANERYDVRRNLVVEEANNIGTLVLRTDVFPDSMRSALRASLKAYVEERILFYEVGMDFGAAAMHYRKADSISGRLWTAVATYARKDGELVRTSEIISSLNSVIDITTTRRAAGEATLPPSILYFLFALCLGTTFILGYDQKGPVNWVVVVGFALMLATTVFTIIDLDRPRSGLINMDSVHARMLDLRAMF